MSPINFDPDFLEYWAQIMCTFIVVPLAIIGTVILIRKDRSLPCILFTVSAALALLSGLFGHLFYIWITDGWLFISDSDRSWRLHLATQGAIAFIQSFTALIATSAFVVYAARRPSATRNKQSSDSIQIMPSSNHWSFPVIFGSIFLVILFSAMVYYHIADSHQRQIASERSIYLMACKTDDLNLESFKSHYRKHYGDIPIPSKHDSQDIVQEVSTFLEKNQGAKLFHYDTPELVWQQLGGRRGYAIVYEAEIIWELVMGRS
jgi:hypothetical protein